MPAPETMVGLAYFRRGNLPPSLRKRSTFAFKKQDSKRTNSLFKADTTSLLHSPNTKSIYFTVIKTFVMQFGYDEVKISYKIYQRIPQSLAINNNYS
jgi:hypothetical protein